jgi:hypothetical protein
MTANQKAATFIGWKPDMTCKEALDFSNSKRGMHWHEAPDMSRPENYIKALDSIPREYDVVIEDRWQVTIQRDTDTHGGTNFITFHVDTDCGVAVVDALADLYDATHPEQAEAQATNQE